MLLYKLFFFNYVFSVSGDEIVNCLISQDLKGDLNQYAANMKVNIHEKDYDFQQNQRDIEEDKKKAVEENHKTVWKLMNSLFVAIQTLKDRGMNLKND